MPNSKRNASSQQTPQGRSEYERMLQSVVDATMATAQRSKIIRERERKAAIAALVAAMDQNPQPGDPATAAAFHRAVQLCIFDDEE